MRTFPTLCTLSAIILPIQASTVLVDGTTRNGNFSELLDPSFDDGDAIFSETANWTNVGTTSQAAQSVRDNPLGLDSTGDYPGASGGYNAVVPDNDTRRFANDTGHTVSPGNTFDFSLHWIDAFNWVDASDQIAFRFFTTTDNDILGAEEDSLVFLSGNSTVSGAYQEFSQTGVSLPAAFEGDTLFVAFYGVDGSGLDNGFARVDDFSLSVIPEPSALSLIGLAAMAFLRRRR